jgi:hypothetical protein
MYSDHDRTRSAPTRPATAPYMHDHPQRAAAAARERDAAPWDTRVRDQRDLSPSPPRRRPTRSVPVRTTEHCSCRIHGSPHASALTACARDDIARPNRWAFQHACATADPAVSAHALVVVFHDIKPLSRLLGVPRAAAMHVACSPQHASVSHGLSKPRSRDEVYAGAGGSGRGQRLELRAVACVAAQSYTGSLQPMHPPVLAAPSPTCPCSSLRRASCQYTTSYVT